MIFMSFVKSTFVRKNIKTSSPVPSLRPVRHAVCGILHCKTLCFMLQKAAFYTVGDGVLQQQKPLFSPGNAVFKARNSRVLA